MTKGETERLEELEILATHQARALDDLNDTVVRQAAEIDRLGRIVEALVKRFQEVEDIVRPDTPVTKPPHW